MSASAIKEASCENNELERKRARDRKAQNAMRHRAKQTVDNLTYHVSALTTTLEARDRSIAELQRQIDALEAENESLKAQNATFRQTIGELKESKADHAARLEPCNIGPMPPWRIPPMNTPPSCLSDQLLQGLLESRAGNRGCVASKPLKPDVGPLLAKEERAADEISNIVSDIVRSYAEIETLPNQVAIHFVMSVLLKWQVLLDKASWDVLPTWMRPTQSQTSTPHAAWIDRVPWPKARDWLIAHPRITLDGFAALYSSTVHVHWPYSDAHVITNTASGATHEIWATRSSGRTGTNRQPCCINPVFEEHVRDLRNWAVGPAFRRKFPELALAMDEPLVLRPIANIGCCNIT